MTINELKKTLKERKVSEEDFNLIVDKATEILDDAKEQVSKVYGEVRRYVITSELRTGCVQHHFKKIPSMSDELNDSIAKEIFSMALETVNKSDKHSIDDIEEEFDKINVIALNLFDVASKAELSGDPQKKKSAHHKHHSSKSHSPFSLLEDLF